VEIFKFYSLFIIRFNYVLNFFEIFTGTLVGMKSKKHTTENLKVCYLSKVDPEEFWDFLRPPQEEINKID